MMRLQVGMVVFFLCVSGCAVQSKVDDSPETRDPESQAFIEWAADHMVALESLDTSAAGTDLESLQQILGPARLVGPGESRHDTREQLLLKGRLVRHLIEDLEFRALILEESVAHAESLDHYVTSDEGNLPDLPPGERAFEPVSEDVMDGALAAVGKTSFLLDLRGVEQDSSASRWLRKERQWKAQDSNALLVPSTAFDLVYFVDKISRSQPTPLALQRFQSLGQNRSNQVEAEQQ